MEQPVHTLLNLFDQPGLVSTQADMETCAELDCFSTARKSFLQEVIKQDADRAPVIDTLNSMRRRKALVRPS